MDEFHRRGTPVVGVVVDPVETNAQLAHDANLGFPIVSDPDLQIIDAYGLRHAGAGPDGHDVARTASVLVDAQGHIRWTFVTTNVRVRPLPDDILAAIDRLR
jgi:peroxiredoxin